MGELERDFNRDYPDSLISNAMIIADEKLRVTRLIPLVNLKSIDPLLKPLANKWKRMTKLRKQLGGKFIEYSFEKLVEDFKSNHKDENIFESSLVFDEYLHCLCLIPMEKMSGFGTLILKTSYRKNFLTVLYLSWRNQPE